MVLMCMGQPGLRKQDVRLQKISALLSWIALLFPPNFGQTSRRLWSPQGHWEQGVSPCPSKKDVCIRLRYPQSSTASAAAPITGLDHPSSLDAGLQGSSVPEVLCAWRSWLSLTHPS